MWKKLTLAAGVLLVLLALLAVTVVTQRSQARTALADYKAQLRAQGEALTWKELGYPAPAETNTSFVHFLAAVNQLGTARPHPAELAHMQFVAPGTAQVGWAAPQPLLSSFVKPSTNTLTWEQFMADMKAVSNTLAKLRTSLQNPPRYFPMNLTNPLATTPKNPFVEKRIAAQWLAADSLAALREKDLARAQADLHTLTQMVQLHRDDTSLVSAMIRVAIASLGLSATWEALPAKGWTEPALAQLQDDWMAMNLIDALERALVTERVWVLQIFESAMTNPQSLGSTTTGRSGGLLNRIEGHLAAQYWRQHMEEDFLLYVQEMQSRIDATRQLQTNAPGHNVVGSIQAQQNALDAQLKTQFNRYRFALTAIAMPNFTRACQTVLRNETLRRLTITAIALERYRLRHGHPPATLDALLPEFVFPMPLDPQSGQLFGYRTNAGGSHTLCSVGEDGVNDGGDTTSTNTVKTFDLWSGRDAVWPRAISHQPSVDR